MQKANWAFYIAGQAGVVPVAYGIPGVAKTSSLEALAKATGREFISFVLQHHMPEDFGGFPVVRTLTGPDGQTYEAMVRVPDEKIVRARMRPSVVLFDELTNAGHAIQAAALLLIQSGIPGAWMFAAANPPELAAAGVDLTPPMVNRLCILQWQPDHEGWDAGCRAGFEFGSPDVPVLPDDWKDYCLKWGPIMAAFRSVFPTLWASAPQDPSTAAKPFPTPRSWRNVGVLCAAAESVNAGSNVQAELVYGCVGEAAGTQFLQWLASQGLPDPESVLRNPASLKLPRRGDMAIAVVQSVINRVRENNSPDRWEALRDVIEAVWPQSEEIAMSAEGMVWRIKPEGYTPVQRNGVWAEMAKVRVAQTR